MYVCYSQSIRDDEVATERKRKATQLAKEMEADQIEEQAKKAALKEGKRARTAVGSVFEQWS